MKKNRSSLENFVKDSLTKVEKRNTIGSAPEKDKPKPPFTQGNPLGSSTNGDGKMDESIPSPPLQEEKTKMP
ncbi:hypothetical protein ACFSX9_08990 [Flavobacterium ardleyense]|uniref:Uncharacterized protein n=1 Tax=Flavobacterium ardleyense TaxID=2038737 RepID=A0ABW5Z838_9FLAO